MKVNFRYFPFLLSDFDLELIITTELRLVLLGSSESDKAAVRNIIRGSVERNQAATPTTTGPQQNEKAHMVPKRKVDVLDTPELSLENLEQTVGPQAFLLVLPVKHSGDKMYFEDETQVTLSKMEEILEGRCWRNTMILFTSSDELQGRRTEEFIQSGDPKLRGLVEKCENRFHCLNIREGGDGSQVSELLEGVEKMVDGNRNGTEIYQIIGAMEGKRRDEKDARSKVQHEMQKALGKCEQFIKDYEEDLKREDISASCKEFVRKLKQDHELKRDIGKRIKNIYDRVAGLDKNTQFIRAILPETQQVIWLSLPGDTQTHSGKRKQLAQLEQWFSKGMGKRLYRYYLPDF